MKKEDRASLYYIIDFLILWPFRNHSLPHIVWKLIQVFEVALFIRAVIAYTIGPGQIGPKDKFSSLIC